MLVIRCTAKLRRRLSSQQMVDVARSTTRLGDWYATILHLRPAHVILLVNEPSRLAAMLPAREFSTLARRIPEAIAEVLRDLGISQAAIARERREMQEVAFAKTASRSVLGTMNDLAFQMETLRAGCVTFSGGPGVGENPDLYSLKGPTAVHVRHHSLTTARDQRLDPESPLQLLGRQAIDRHTDALRKALLPSSDEACLEAHMGRFLQIIGVAWALLGIAACTALTAHQTYPGEIQSGMNAQFYKAIWAIAFVFFVLPGAGGALFGTFLRRRTPPPTGTSDPKQTQL